MELLLIGLSWSVLLAWMRIRQRVYRENRRLEQGIDQQGSPFGGLVPLIIAGLLLGLTLAWLGFFKTLGLLGLALLASWAIQRLRKIEAQPFLGPPSLPFRKSHR